MRLRAWLVAALAFGGALLSVACATTPVEAMPELSCQPETSCRCKV